MAEKVTSSEEWRPIPFVPDHEVSSWGRVRSLGRYRRHQHLGFLKFYSGKIIKIIIEFDRYGYPKVRFNANSRPWSLPRAVCWAFHGKPPSPKHEAAHLDNDPINNTPSNLKWCTRIENHSHKLANGTHPHGENNPSAKLTEEDVRKIRTLKASGLHRDDLSIQFGISKCHVNDIVAGRYWGHIQ